MTPTELHAKANDLAAKVGPNANISLCIWSKLNAPEQPLFAKLDPGEGMADVTINAVTWDEAFARLEKKWLVESVTARQRALEKARATLAALEAQEPDPC